MSSPLVTFLFAQLDADQAAADDAETACWHIDYCDDRGEPFHDRLSAARVLVEVEAKRQIIAAVDALDKDGDIRSAIGTYLDTDAIWTALALPYADRDGYDPHWAPAPDPVIDDQLERYEAAARGLRGNLLAMVAADMPQPSHLKTAITGMVNHLADTVEGPSPLREMIRNSLDLRPSGNGACYEASWGWVHSQPSCRCPR
ncbi:MAG TPA: DUF6221 family protein [Pedococcus sp.]|nr:DUF6221 family protein [Pedococcus sp.]